MIYQMKKINPVALNEPCKWKCFVLEDPIVLTSRTVPLGTCRRLKGWYYLRLKGQVFQDFLTI